MAEKSPEDVASEAIEAFIRPILEVEEVINKTLIHIEKDKRIQLLSEGKGAFKAAVYALISAFPGYGYEAWYPEKGPRWEEAMDHLTRHWDSQTGSGK